MTVPPKNYTPEQKQKISESVKQSWQNSDRRKTQDEAHKRGSEHRQKTRQRWKDET